jgi:NAD+ diphosphatase
MTLSYFTNIFAGNPLDRASYRRSDAAWIAAQLAAADSLGVVLWNGKPLVEDRAGQAQTGKVGEGVQIAYVSAGLVEALAGGGLERLLFLGLWQGVAVFAVDLDGVADPADGPLEGLGRFEDLRAIALSLPGTEAGILATAKAMFEWRRKHRHCAACGQPSEVSDGGWKRVCPACATQHFPRTDPVVIMLAVKGDKCLVGRQAVWPRLMYSALAGFLEPGETIEEACARELWEEARLRTTRVRYHSTQPWPYPSSLMIGLIAEVENDDAVADQVELEEVRWMTRDQVRAMLRGELADAKAPGAMAIAHQLISSWAEETPAA